MHIFHIREKLKEKSPSEFFLSTLLPVGFKLLELWEQNLILRYMLVFSLVGHNTAIWQEQLVTVVTRAVVSSCIVTS